MPYYPDSRFGGGGASLPDQTGHVGETLITDGTDVSWGHDATKANKAGETYSGTHNFSGATTVRVPTVTPANTSTTIAASTAFTHQAIDSYNTGLIFGGSLTGDNTSRSTAVGVLSVAGPAVDAVAIGNESTAGSSGLTAHGAIAVGSSASASHMGSVSVGHAAESVDNGVSVGGHAYGGAGDVVVGRQAWGIGSAVAVGYQAVAGNAAVAVGMQAGRQLGSSVNYIAIGRTAKAETDAVAIGHLGKATAIGSTAIGKSAEASAVGAVALGRNSKATFDNSIAFGEGVETSTANELAVGAKHILISELTTPPAGAPAAGTARLMLVDDGNGKLQLAIRFPTGTTQIIATEP